MTLDVRTTPEADDQVRAIDGWWQRHRIAAPILFLDEREAAVLTQIGNAPDVGHSYRRTPIVGTRRVLLPRTRDHVHYVPREAVVLVLAVWHAKRGSGPPLRLL